MPESEREDAAGKCGEEGGVVVGGWVGGWRGHPANWVCSLIKLDAGELRGLPVALHINDRSAF